MAVAVQPRAAKNAVAGVVNGALKIRLTSPPVDGAANKALARFLAEILETNPGRIAIVSGGTARHKIIEVQDMPAEELSRRLQPFLTNPAVSI